MKNHALSFVAAVAALAATSSLSAQSLADVILDPSVSITSVNFELYYDDAVEALFNTGTVASSTGLGSLVTTADFFDLFSAITSLGVPTFDPFGDDDFTLLDGDSFLPLLSGDLLDSVFDGSLSEPIQLLFEVTGGDLAPNFGPYVVISLSGFTGAASLTVPTDLPNGFDTTPTSVMATLSLVSASLIPEANSSGVLALLGVGTAVALRRRR